MKVVSHQSPTVSLICFIRVVSHQSGLSTEWSRIRVVFHQGGPSSGWSFTRSSLIKVISHHGGLSRRSLIRMFIPQNPRLRGINYHHHLTTRWSLIRVVFHQVGLSSTFPKILMCEKSTFIIISYQGFHCNKAPGKRQRR